jgi:hypothetical protein
LESIQKELESAETKELREDIEYNLPIYEGRASPDASESAKQPLFNSQKQLPETPTYMPPGALKKKVKAAGWGRWKGCRKQLPKSPFSASLSQVHRYIWVPRVYGTRQVQRQRTRIRERRLFFLGHGGEMLEPLAADGELRGQNIVTGVMNRI